MWIAGLILLVFSVAMTVGYRSRKRRLALMADTETVQVSFLEELARSMSEGTGAGNLSYYAELYGQAEPDQEMVSELSQTACVHYSMSVKRRYEETVYEEDEKGNRVARTVTRTETLANNSRSMPFYLKDATGRIYVDPYDANMVSEQVLSRFEPASALQRGLLRFGGMELRVPAAGSGRKTIGFEFSESAIAANRMVFIMGEISDKSGRLTVQKPADKRDFIVSLKSEAALQKENKGSMTLYLVGAIGCAVVGVGLILWHFLSPGAPPAP